MNIESIKEWLRIDYNFEDKTILSILESAKEELHFSGVPEYKDGEVGYSLYCSAIKYIISRDYETRGFVKENYNSKDQKSFNEKALQSFILKLKKWWCYVL